MRYVVLQCRSGRALSPAQPFGHRERHTASRIDVHVREDAHVVAGCQNVMHEVDRPLFVRAAHFAAWHANGG